MYEMKVKEHFSAMPVFRLADLTQIIQNKDYAKKFLQKMVKRGEIKKIKRDFYTLHEDPFLVSAFLSKPCYISTVSALYYHHLITQIPNEIFCFTTKRTGSVDFISKINFFHTKYFFGFKPERCKDFVIPIATPEKAIIDSMHIVPFSVFEEAFDEIEINTMVYYLKKIKKSSIVKRMGYLAERNGFSVYEKLKNFVNSKYIFLDPVAKKVGRKDKKWKVVVNG